MSKAKNHMFFSSVVEKVHKISLSAIVSKHTKVRVNRLSDHDALCPFHEDRYFGSFKINDKKNICKCFTCGYFGDGIQFVKDILKDPNKPISNKEAYKRAVLRIGVDHGICTKEQAEEYLGGVISDTRTGEISADSIRAEEKIDGITEIASPYVRDWAYRLFLEDTSLSEEHRNYLRNRGLSDEEINEKGFFSFPKPTEDFLNKLHERCKQNNFTPNIFKKVPGFHTSEKLALDTFQPSNGDKEYRYTFSYRKGIGIPTKDAQGNIVGIQIRKDSAETKKRYTWFSSSYAAYDDNDYIFGTPAGAPTHVAYPKKYRYQGVVFITEGFFKAEEVAKTFGVPCVSVSGVGNYRSIPEDLKGIEQKTRKSIEHIYIAYDADMSENLQVYLHSKNLVELIKESFTEVIVYMSLWKESDGKGIDDLIHNNKAHTLKKVSFEDFATLYDQMVDRLEKEYKTIHRVPKEVVAKQFYSGVFPKVYAS